MRAWLRVAGIVAALALCYPPHLVLGLLGLRSRWATRFLRLVGRIAGLRIRVEGNPLAHDVLFVSNHLSWLDILVLGGSAGARFVSKAEVRGWPAIGWLASLNQTVFIERARRGAVSEQADSLAATLAEGRPVTLFAEGTTGDGVDLLPFRASLFAAVAGRGTVAVQPVALRYREPAALRWPREEAANHNAMRILARPGRIDVTARFLPPIDPAGLDRKEIAARAEQAVRAALTRVT